MAQWLLLPGTLSHNVTTPDHADLDIIADVDMRIRLALADPTPASNQSPIGKYLGTGNQRSYWGRVGTTGILTFVWSVDGAAGLSQLSSVAYPFAADEIGWIRYIIDTDNGAGGANISWFTSDDDTNDPDAPVWDQLGIAKGTTATSIFAGTAPLEVGSVNGGTEPVAGKIFVAAVYNGIDGTKVAHFDAEDFEVGDSDTDTAADVTGKTWTINGANSVIETDVEASPGGNLLLLGVG